MNRFEPILLRYINEPGSHTIDFYLGHDGYQAAWKAVREFEPDRLIEEVKRSGLRGRGGAGFPCGTKWGFVPKDTDKPKYLVCNADESEPGTFKDRAIIEKDPHQLIEGIIIACWAVQIHTCYIYIRGEFVKGARILQGAIQEAYAKGILGRGIFGTDFHLDVTVHRGAGAYICGEETALLSSLEGGRGNPRIRPPFPATRGLFGSPTVINNVETLANLPHIIRHGASWYRQIGTQGSPGPKIFCLSGHVLRPGLYELPLGTPLRSLIYELGGGLTEGKLLKAIHPGGTSSPVLTADQIDVGMDFESIAAAGSMLGTGSVIVMNEDTCMVNALWNILRFYHHESCGQCTPCREGLYWLEKIVARIERGRGQPEDLRLIVELCDNMFGKTVCVLADAAALPAKSYVERFGTEFEDHIGRKGCRFKVKAEVAG
jgi:NADH-quinone oxidoreductase subunit F